MNIVDKNFSVTFLVPCIFGVWPLIQSLQSTLLLLSDWLWTIPLIWAIVSWHGRALEIVSFIFTKILSKHIFRLKYTINESDFSGIFISDRAALTLQYMAPAVFYGGFSTFLAFILLAGSTSYVFSTFFKVSFEY